MGIKRPKTRRLSRLFLGLAMAGFMIAGLSAAAAAKPSAVYEARYEVGPSGDKQQISPIRKAPGAGPLAEPIQRTSFPQFVAEHQPASKSRIVVLRGRSRSLVRERLDELGVLPREIPPAPVTTGRDEVTTLVESGPADNRIDLVFMGDGYTEDQKAKFESDIQRIVDDMFQGPTFRSYLPLFNVHMVFRASNESGIGTQDVPNDTAYGLYRSGDTLRAIYPSNLRAARASCRQAPGCDYPVIIANDPYYGGLGGEVAISTSSKTSGVIVLRHELGHNFGRVGEEYDGGGYFGANHSSSLRRLKWKHWATELPVEAEPSQARVVEWPWENLEDGPYSTSFRSNGAYDYTSIRISASGVETDDTLSLHLDDREIDVESPGTKDRTFHDYFFETGLESGRHTLRFRENVSDGDNWVSSVTLHEYKEGYHFANDYIGAYPVFTKSGTVAGYRSNHELCLMRNMASPHFCPICQENNWLKFFGKVRLIDQVEVQAGADEAANVEVKTQDLGQFRPDSQGEGPRAAKLHVRWYKDGEAQPELANRRHWSRPAEEASGRWRVEVRYETPEVRKDPRDLLSDEKEFRVRR